MNAIAPLQQAHDTTPWDEAAAAVNAWRGHALQCFAQAEAAVSETLLVMASVPQGNTKVRLRRLVGQRFEDVRDAAGVDGPFGAEGAKAMAALEAFRDYESLRPFLCHGVAKVTLDRQHRWLITLKILSFRSRQEERSSRPYEEREAEVVLIGLKAATHQLASALQSLRARIGDQTGPRVRASAI